MGRYTVAMVAVLLAVLPAIGFAGQMQTSSGVLQWGGCAFDNPAPGRIDCATLHRRVKNATGETLSMRLPLVRIRYDYARAKSIHGDVSSRRSTPIIYVTGGPGMATGLDKESLPGWLAWYDNQGWPHDLILYDQRGTGLARPKLDCPAIRKAVPGILGQQLSLEKEVAAWEALHTDCRERLLAQGADLSLYSTEANADDLWALIKGLDADGVYLLGQSYGVRVVLRLVARGGGGIKGLVLDSPYPPGVDRTLASPYVVQRSIGALSAACAEDEQCHSRIGDVPELVEDLARKLRDRPLRVVLKTSSTNSLEVVIDDSRFLDILFMVMGQGDPAKGLLPDLKKLQAGQDAPFLAYVGVYLDWMLDEQFSDPVYQLVECHDQPGPISPDQYARALSEHPMLGRLVSDPWLWDKPACPIWGYGSHEIPRARNAAYPIPALILSGELDAVTPPVWAEQVGRLFETSHLVSVPDAGHGLLGGDLCLIWLIRDFWEDPMRAPESPCGY